jgi:GH15 family glucan-1,4-alpha-glucosidase
VLEFHFCRYLLINDKGTRNWDYRYSWVRDASSTFSHEAEAYIGYIFQRIKEAKARRGALPIMFTIWGGTDIPELELEHLEGYRGSQPVRIGNGYVPVYKLRVRLVLTSYLVG